jgi:L-rhamnose mutarotase
MERALFAVRLFPGTELEYDRRYTNVWPELSAEIRDAGFRNLSGFRRGTDCWWYAECEPAAATAFADLASRTPWQHWMASLDSIVAVMRDQAGELLRYHEVFHSDSPEPGPQRRGMFSLVVDPARIPDYDELHAHPWPDMVEALAATGFGNYTGFRRGNHVLYYGEFRPDMDTAFERIGATDVNRRWGEAFEGVITTIRAADGGLITASEIYHQD